jgi:hypothetical protein
MTMSVLVAAFWRWECDLQNWWVRVVSTVGEQYGTDDATQLRMMRLGWSLLLLMTWPQSLVRRVGFVVWVARGCPAFEEADRGGG